jgi:hypothetical protein
MLPADWQRVADTGMRVEKGTSGDGVVVVELLYRDDDLGDSQNADGDGGADADLGQQSCMD